MISPVACKAYLTLKRRLVFNGLHDVSTQKILFTATAVRNIESYSTRNLNAEEWNYCLFLS
jgi:hypothetical protein